MECYLDAHDDHRKVTFEKADVVFLDNDDAPVIESTVINDAENVLFAFLKQVEEK